MSSRRFFLVWLALIGVLTGGVLAWAASTIDPTQPVQGQPYQSAPIRNNFSAAANDIQALQNCNIGPTAPFQCNLANSARCWVNNTSTTAWIWNVCDGPGGQWDAVFTVNPQNHQVIGPPSAPGQRTILTNPLTLFVGPAGNDTNNTCLNQATPCVTMNYALNTILQNKYDLAGFQATIQLLNGSYTENLVIHGPFLGMQGAASITINGNASTPSSVVWNASDPLTVTHGAYVTVSNLQVQASDDCLVASKFGQLVVNNVIVAGCATNALHAWGNGLLSVGPAGMTINGGGAVFARAQEFSLLQLVPVDFSGSIAFTLNGSPSFSGAFVIASRLGEIRAQGAVFSGPATGQRCLANDNGVIFTGTSGNPTFFPGTSPCVTSNGGIYD